MSESLGVVVNILLIFILVLLNGFFVASEFGMVKIRPTRISELANEGNRRARIAKPILANLNSYLSATQLGITLASLGLGWIGEPTIAHLLEGPLHRLGLGDVVGTISYLVAFLVVTVLHIVLGELTPKSFAIQRTEGTVLGTAAPLALFYKIMFPFIWILNGAATRTMRLFGVKPASEEEQAHTEEELRILMSQSHRSGLIDNTEMALFDNIFQFSDRIAREIMVPRIDMIVIPWDATEEQIRNVIEEHQHTRYPIIREDKDTILGYVHIKDLYVQRSERLNLEEVVRTATRIPETTEISHVLRTMQKNRTQMAIVMDEYGGTSGIVTMEDIIEELVGEIQDEFDHELAPIVETKKGYSVDGRLLVEEINDLLHSKLDDTDVDTIGGWVQSILQKTPVNGDTVQECGFDFEVEMAENGRVERILIRTRPED